jgi:beta-mannosidase
MVGLREVTRVPADGQNNRDIPLQFVINGVPFFINGMNWVPPDACTGEIRNEYYDRFLPKFKTGNINLLRVWGGGICEKPYFYNRCNELGILILQEYPIACGLGMSRDQHYLDVLQRETKAIAIKLRKHPSVFLFDGGNENYHYWDMLDSDNPKLREAADDVRSWAGQNRDWLFGASDRYEETVHILLGAVTAENAPGCLYQNTSAMEGEGEAHGPWTWNLAIGDHRYRGYDSFYDFWVNANQHLYSECSVSSIANIETISRVTGNPLFNKIPSWDDSVWIKHHAFYSAWSNFRDNWLDIPSTENVFGKIDNLDELVKANQYLQAEGGRYIVETLRRKQ